MMKHQSPKSRNIVLEPKGLDPKIEVIRETPNYIQFVDRRRYNPNVPGYEPQLQKEKKFLCIGGPFNGKREADIKLSSSGQTYHPFNAARSRVRRPGHWRGNGHDHTQIYIHESLL